MVKLTLFSSEHPLTKTYYIDKEPVSPSFSKGTFKVLGISTHDELAALIMRLDSNQALSYSIPLGFSQGSIVIKGSEEEENNVISRTKEYFDYPAGPGWLFIDCDENLSEQEIVNRLAKLYAPFSNTSYVYATSASHGISGKKGFHLYFKVDDISIVKQAMTNLFRRAFNAGYGWCDVSKNGRLLNRTFFDLTVYDKGRLDFISGPICIGFNPPPRDIREENRINETLSLETLLAPVDAIEAISKEREKATPEADAVTQRLAKQKGISLDKYIVLRDGGALNPGTRILLAEGSEVDVGKIIKLSMLSYLAGEDRESEEVQHPVELGLEDKTMLYFNTDSGLPRIHSFAHGGQTWTLRDDGSVLKEISRRFQGPRYLIENLRAAHQLTAKHQETPRLRIHPDTYAVLHLMLKTFIMEYRSERLLIDQWREMISLFLHIIDGYRGRYSIELPPSHGKTQVICHVILWLYQSKRIVPISLSVFKIYDIKMIKGWLLKRMDHIWRKELDVLDRVSFPYEPNDYLKVRHSQERTSFDELDKAPVIIHTHHVVRKNDFKERFFSYKGKERHLFIFDEAMYRSLMISQDIETSIDHLNYAITRGESGAIKGIPLDWLKAFLKKLKKANLILTENEPIQEVTLEMPQLSERYVRTGYYLKESEPQDFNLTLMNIGATEDREFRVSREKGGRALFAFKENDINKLPRVINTDATRSVRRVHEFGTGCQTYPIKPYDGDKKVTYWIAPFKSTGRDAVTAEAAPHFMVIAYWLVQIKPKKPLFITSKGFKLDQVKLNGTIPVYMNYPNIQQIHWGQHKQTNDYRDCDAVIVLNYFRKRSYNYKHDIHAERGYVEPIVPGVIKDVEQGFIVDELIQGFCRGAMREGKRQHCLMFSPHSMEESLKLTEILMMNVRPKDEVTLFEYPEVITFFDSKYKTEQELQDQKRKTRSDKKYESEEERDWAKGFRRTCTKRGIDPTDELTDSYLSDRRTDPTVRPAKWIKANVTSAKIQ